MKDVKKVATAAMLGLSMIFLLGVKSSVYASAFTEIIPSTFEYYGKFYANCTDFVDWCDWDDDGNTGSTSLGFSVLLGGATYTHFDLDSNGYVELLTGPSDSPTNYGNGSISGLIGDDPTSTYLLAAYDDLSSWDYEFYGYKLFADRAVFYYSTETYSDEGSDYLNNFEIILYSSGIVRWNFNYADYSGYGYDLFSGLYFGNTATLLELTRDEIPADKSYHYGSTVIPEPATLLLLGSGLLGLGAWRRRQVKM